MAHSLPSRLYAIADVGFCEARGLFLEEVVASALAGGVRMLSVRVGDALVGLNEAAREALWAEVARAVARGRQAGAEVLLHAHPERAASLGCGGVHLKGRQVGEVARVRAMLRNDARVGVSCHNAEELRRACEAGADFVTLSPIFASVSKPDYGGEVDLNTWASLIASSPLPVYALGGVRPEHVRRCLEAGFTGVAVIGGLFGAEDVAGAARRYVQSVNAE
ncbi:thiamine phosphate synthase [Lujinxingia sediminis]|uniref:Thiamine phosphate synthase n=1 Tax=Lujinxingia sediminis TaxID=2480984 RepID=A0ABY0CUJ0_9DELT|nr:thiamine phosphate synthase [Lujinxingia sediminis]RVU46737.1 thiamine phosphate synthase [Lujinxingia sediminis]